MRNLLETNSLSWAHTVRITLEAEGIHAVVLDELAPALHAFNIRIRVAVPDGDLDKARAIVARITPRSSGPPPSWRIQKRGLICVGIGVVVGMYGLGRLQDQGPGPLTYTLAGVGLLGVLVGFLVIALGPRADRQQSHPKGDAG